MYESLIAVLSASFPLNRQRGMIERRDPSTATFAAALGFLDGSIIQWNVIWQRQRQSKS